MNPRRRRLLFPALLVVLLVVAAVVSLARDADARPLGPSSLGALPAPATLSRADDETAVAARVVSTVRDPRISESSGLAVSAVHDDLAYTINDSGNADVVYAVRISTGEVVGTTTVSGTPWVDTEAMTLHDGKLWIGDVGDNSAQRRDTAIYAIDEPGPGTHAARSTRYPVGYSDGPHDVESLAVDGDGRFLLVTKDLLSGQVLRFPDPLSTQRTNVPEPVGAPTLLMATDASTSPDGRFVVVRNYIAAAVLDASDLSLVRTEALPEQAQGETLAFEPSGASYLIGSEGSPWQIQRVGFSADRAGAAVPSATPTPTATTPAAATTPSAPAPTELGRPWFAVAVGGLAVLLLAAFGVWITRRDDD